jgi:16S rRNA (adenine(1408)-N(1))-methyltransferase
VIVDLGTGDGRAVLARAAADPAALVIGIDAAAASMAESSRRAARSVRRGGAPNALFLAAGAEALDPVLAAAADLVTVAFPWGSLLLGALGLDANVADALGRLVKPGGTVLVHVSIAGRDGIAGIDWLDAAGVADAAARLASHGLLVRSAEIATPAGIAATGSTWGRRLGAGRDRDAWRLELVREIVPGSAPDQVREVDPSIVAVDIEAVAAEEAHEGHAEALGRVDREVGRSRDRRQNGHAGHGGLLDDLEAHPAAHEHDAIVER